MNKKYLGIVSLTLVATCVIGVYVIKDNFTHEVNDKEEYIEDDYEKFLQEKVLPDMIKNNNEDKNQSCELNQQGEAVTEVIDLGNGVIELQENNFMAKLDELHMNLDKYIGREISYEGVIYKIEDEGNPVYIVGRYIDEAHGDHSHENFFGIQGIYDGQWPEVNTWVQVKGIVTKSEFHDEELPAIKLEEVITKSKEVS